jgi:hypothetical protein
MERHQDDPLRKLGEIELRLLYWAQAGTHIGGTRRGSHRRDRPDFGREGSFLVKVTRIVNQHVVEVLNPSARPSSTTLRNFGIGEPRGCPSVNQDQKSYAWQPWPAE